MGTLISSLGAHSRQADTEARADFLKGEGIKGDNSSYRVPGLLLPRKEIFYTSWSLQTSQKRNRLEMGQEQMATPCVAMTLDTFERPQQAGTVPHQTFLGSSRAMTTNTNETCPSPSPKAFETLSPSTVVGHQVTWTVRDNRLKPWHSPRLYELFLRSLTQPGALPTRWLSECLCVVLIFLW